MNLFIVDDSEAVREMLSEFLELEPAWAVIGEAGSGEEALAALPTTDADLALIDVSMPRMNGIELVRRLATEAPDLPCVMYSAHADEVYVQQAREAGAAGYVMKGNPNMLIVAVRQVLAGETSFVGAFAESRRRA